jgi:outer membrane protein OmpA-like peptidoglycan-associated protein
MTPKAPPIGGWQPNDVMILLPSVGKLHGDDAELSAGPAGWKMGGMTMKAYHRLVACAGLALVLIATDVAAQDVAGSQDHPVIGQRFPGSVITSYGVQEFDEYALLTGPVPSRNEIGDAEYLEGRITKIIYEMGAERSTLEVMRNYENAFKTLGFEILYGCKNEDCGGRGFNHNVVPYIARFAENYGDQRYRAARLDGPDGATYISLYVVKNLSEGGPHHAWTYARLVVIETEEMQTELVTVAAGEMLSAIAETGAVALYGIQFDFDSAKILPSSRPALDEIGKLLRDSGSLDLYVVGHTDNAGSLDYNLDLSRQRAESVVRDLAETYGIDPARLDPRGVGYLAPVASNTEESGRALNRRVELVAR